MFLVLGIPKWHQLKSRKYSGWSTTGKNKFIEGSVSKCAKSWCKIHLLHRDFALVSEHDAINVLTLEDRTFHWLFGRNKSVVNNAFFLVLDSLDSCIGVWILFLGCTAAEVWSLVLHFQKGQVSLLWYYNIIVMFLLTHFCDKGSKEQFFSYKHLSA
jgi:hypothetical protein